MSAANSSAEKGARAPVRKSRAELPLAVVVGAGAMGMAIARRLGERHRLILADRDAPHLERKLATLREEGHDAAGVTCDVTDADAVAALVEHARALAPLRVLAHVVGLSPSMADWRRIMSVNLTGARMMADSFLPLAQPGTAAIFVGSIAGYNAHPSPAMIEVLAEPLNPGFLDEVERVFGSTPAGVNAYALSKFGLMGMCERLAPVWGARGARILSVSPGLISTPMGDLEFENLPAKFDMLGRTPLRRQGTMLEIADAVDFLSSDRASFISGIDLVVDGGLTAVDRHRSAPKGT